MFSLCSFIAANAQSLNTTTTLAAETGNNTSTAPGFVTQSNGNLGATNISKVPLSTLLYNGNTTNIYVHFMPWFGGTNHMNVGYTSNDPAQVQRQVTDMLSRGAQGAIVDWYGQSHTREDQTTQFLRNEAESRGGAFEFAVMEDKGALSCSDTTTCTSALLSDINYANTMYFSSPAYMRINGRPVLFFFGVEGLPVDWAAARQDAAGNPLFIFENSMTRTADDGAFTWVQGINSFYQTAQQYPGKILFGSAAKGFNDTLASWGSNRITAQNCGQFWLTTWGYASQYWSTSNPLQRFQVVTWNDYEEGTEIESGIDNCVSVAAAMSDASTLGWTITGSETTIDHYTVFASTDGQNLAKIGNVAAGIHTYNVPNANLPAGNYTLFVQAVGRPSLTNKMSAGIAYTAPASTGSGSGGSAGSGGSSGGTSGSGTTSGSGSGSTSASPDLSVSVAPAAMTVAQGQSGTTTINVTPQSGFQGGVTFACSNLPANARCSFAPSTVTLGNSAASTTVSISTATSTTVGALHGTEGQNPMLRLWGFGTPAFGLAGLVFVGTSRKRKALLASAAAMLLLILLTACGSTGVKSSTSTSQSAAATPRGNYQITITAVSGSISHSTTVNLTVQ